MTRRPLLTLAGVAIAMLTSVLGGQTMGDDSEDETPTLSVSGTASISARPDVADIQIGVVSHAETARDALAANNKAMTALHAELKERGVADKDIQTSQFNINPQYSQPQPGRENQGEFIPRVVGYQVTNMVQITARDLDKLGVLLDAVVQQGANQIHGISFRIDDSKQDSLLDQARKDAVKDARRKAELLAGETGMVLGSPRSITDVGGSAPPPMPKFGRAMMAASVPIAPGEEELSVTIQIVYTLKAPK